MSRYIQEMYDWSIMIGPMLFLKPAENYPLYTAFCEFQNPQTVYEKFEEFPPVIHRSWNCGKWNIMVVSKRQIDFTLLKGFNRYICQGPKSVTCLSRVNFLDWSTSMKKMRRALSLPEEKTTLYGIGPPIPWDNKDWTIYEEQKWNMRTPASLLHRRYSIRHERYQKWAQTLPQFALIQTAFYPYGIQNYFFYDFLFGSDYHQQLTDILCMLPSTGVFFSVGDFLFARLAVLNPDEASDLFSLIAQLQKLNFLTEFKGGATVPPENHEIKKINEWRMIL